MGIYHYVSVSRNNNFVWNRTIVAHRAGRMSQENSNKGKSQQKLDSRRKKIK